MQKTVSQDSKIVLKPSSAIVTAASEQQQSVDSDIMAQTYYKHAGKDFLLEIQSDDIEKIKQLLEDNPLLLNEKLSNKRTPLEFAINANQKELVKLLLSFDQLSLNVGDIFHPDAEDYAKFWGKEEIARLINMKKHEMTLAKSSHSIDADTLSYEKKPTLGVAIEEQKILLLGNVTKENAAEILTDYMSTYPTKGEGDCAFHAILGEWNESYTEFVCKDVDIERKKIAEAIRGCKLGDSIYMAVKEAIQQHIMTKSGYVGKELNAAIQNYNSFLSNNSASMENLWQKFENELENYSDILEYIKKNIPPTKNILNFKSKFWYCINEDKGELQDLIDSIPKLKNMYKDYKDEINRSIDLDALLKKQELLDEYAALMEQAASTHGSGYWLLPTELVIVALVLDLTIKYYITDTNTQKIKRIETYNPGYEVKKVYFDGKGHYEKVKHAEHKLTHEVSATNRSKFVSTNFARALPSNIELITSRQIEVKKELRRSSRNFIDSHSLSEELTVEKAQGINNVVLEKTPSALNKDGAHVYRYRSHIYNLNALLELAQGEESSKEFSQEDLKYVAQCSLTDTHSFNIFSAIEQQSWLKTANLKIVRLSIKTFSYLAQNRKELTKSVIKILLNKLDDSDAKVSSTAAIALSYAVNNGQALAEDDKEEKTFIEKIANKLRALSCDKDALLHFSTQAVGYCAIAKKKEKLCSNDLEILKKLLTYVQSDKDHPLFKAAPYVDWHPKSRIAWFSSSFSILSGTLGELRKIKEISRSNNPLAFDELKYSMRYWNENDVKNKRKSIQILRYAIQNGQGNFFDDNDKEKAIAALTDGSKCSDRKIRDNAIIGLACLIKNHGEKNDHHQIKTTLDNALSEVRYSALLALDYYIQLIQSDDSESLAKLKEWFPVLELLKEDESQKIRFLAGFIEDNIKGDILNQINLLLDHERCVETTYKFSKVAEQRNFAFRKEIEQILDNLEQLISGNYPNAAKYNAAVILSKVAENGGEIPLKKLTAFLNYTLTAKAIPNIKYIELYKVTFHLLGFCATKKAVPMLGDLDLKNFIFALLSEGLNNNDCAYEAVFAIENIIQHLGKNSYSEYFLPIFSMVSEIIISEENNIKVKSAASLMISHTAKKGWLLTNDILDKLGMALDKNNDEEVVDGIFKAIKYLLENNQNIAITESLAINLSQMLKKDSETIRNNVTWLLCFYIEKTLSPLPRSVILLLEKEMFVDIDRAEPVIEILRAVVERNWPVSLNLERLSTILKSESASPSARVNTIYILGKIIEKYSVKKTILTNLYHAVEDSEDEVVEAAVSILRKISFQEIIRNLLPGQNTIQKLAEIVSNFYEKMDVRVDAAYFLRQAALSAKIRFPSESIYTLKDALNSEDSKLCKVIIPILENQIFNHYKKDPDAVNEILEKLWEMARNQELLLEIVHFLKSANKVGYLLSEDILEVLIRVLLENIEKNVRNDALEILLIIKSKNELSTKIVEVIDLEINGIIIEDAKKTLSERVKAAKAMIDLIDKGNFLTQNNLLTISNLIKRTSKKFELLENILNVIYFASKNEQRIPKFLLEEIVKLLSNSLVEIKSYAARSLCMIAKQGGYIPEDVFSIVEGLIVNHKKLNLFEDYFVVIHLAIRKGAAIQRDTLLAIIELLDNEDLKIRNEASRVIYSIAESGQNIDFVVENIIKIIQSSKNSDTAKVLSDSLRIVCSNKNKLLNQNYLARLHEILKSGFNTKVNYGLEVEKNILQIIASQGDTEKLSEELVKLVDIKTQEHILIDDKNGVEKRIKALEELQYLSANGLKACENLLQGHSLNVQKTILNCLLKINAQKKEQVFFPESMLELLSGLLDANLNNDLIIDLFEQESQLKRRLPVDSVIAKLMEIMLVHSDSNIRKKVFILLIGIDEHQPLSEFQKLLISIEEIVIDPIQAVNINERQLKNLLAKFKDVLVKCQDGAPVSINGFLFLTQLIRLNNHAFHNAIIDIILKSKNKIHSSCREHLLHTLTNLNALPGLNEPKLIKICIEMSPNHSNDKWVKNIIKSLFVITKERKLLELIDILFELLKRNSTYPQDTFCMLNDLISIIFKNGKTYTDRFKLKFFKILSYIHRSQQDFLLNSSALSVIEDNISKKIGKGILEKINQIDVRKKINIFLTSLSTRCCDSSFLDASVHDVDKIARQMLCHNLLIKVKKNYGSMEDDVKLFDKYLLELEKSKNYSTYDEGRDNVLSLLIEKQEKNNLKLNEVNELLAILKHIDVSALKKDGDFKLNWLKDELSTVLLNSDFAANDVDHICFSINGYNWSVKLIELFLMAIKKIKNKVFLKDFVDLYVLYEVDERLLHDLFNEIVSSADAFSIKKWILSKEVFFIVEVFCKEGVVYNNKTKDRANELKECLSRCISMLLDKGWSFEKIYKALECFKNATHHNLLLSFESLQMLFDIAYSYEFSEKEFYEYGSFLEPEKIVKKLHEDGLKKYFKNEDVDKNNPKKLQTLFSELQHDNENNKLIKVLLSGSKLKDMFNAIQQTYDDKPGLLISQHKSLKPISKWGTEDIQAWAKNIKNHANRDDVLPEIIAVIKHACLIGFDRNIELREIQILSVLIFLDGDLKPRPVKSDSKKARLAEVLTGEGKSLIIAMLATIRGLRGKKVDIITSSAGLAKRDVDLYQKYYNLFNLKADHNEDKKYIRGLKKCYAGDVNIIYGSISDFQFDRLRDEYEELKTRGNRPFEMVIVDEVDSLLIDEGSKIAMLGRVMPGIESLKNLLILISMEFKCIRRFVNDNICYQENNSSKRIFKITNQEEFIKCKLLNYINEIILKQLKLVPENFHDFVEIQKEKWVKNVILAYQYKEEVQYRIKRDNNGILSIIPVDLYNTGDVQIGTTWGDGLQQFLQIKHGLEITSESLIVNFISNMACVKYYENVCGLTGTSGSHAAQNLLSDSETYNMDFAYITTFKEKRFKELPGVIAASTQWMSEIEANALREAKNGRVVLILCETIKIAKEVNARLVKNYKRLYVELYIENKDESQQFLTKSLDEGMIIVATNVAGRGADIKMSPKVLEKGGLHVCFTFLALNMRVEKQGWGRASRAGHPGTGQLILNQEELQKKLSIYQDYDFIDFSNLDIDKIRKMRDEIETKHLNQFKETELSKTVIKDKLYEEFLELLKALAKVDSSGEFAYKRKAIEEHWAIWLKKFKDKEFEAGLLQKFNKFKKEILLEYNNDSVIKNPFYHINRGCDFLEYADTYTGKIISQFTYSAYENAVKSFKKAVELDPEHAYMAYYNIVYPLVKTAKIYYKEDVKNYARKFIHVVKYQVLPELMAVSQTLNSMRMDDDEKTYNELSQQLSCKIQVLHELMISCYQIIAEVELSQKLIDVSFAKNDETVNYYKLDRAKAIEAVNASDKNLTVSFHGLGASSAGYRAKTTIESAPENAQIDIIFKERGHKEKLKKLLPINRRLEDVIETEKLEKQKTTNNKADNFTLRDSVYGVFEKTLEGGKSVVKKTEGIRKTFAAPLVYVKDCAEYGWDKYHYDGSEKNLVTVSMEHSSFNNFTDVLKIIEDSSNNVTLILQNIEKGFLQAIISSAKFSENLIGPLYEAYATLVDEDDKAIKKKVTKTDELDNKSVYMVYFSNVRVKRASWILEELEKLEKNLKKLDNSSLNYYSSSTLTCSKLDQNSAEKLIDSAIGEIALSFESLYKKEAVTIIHLTEHYNREAIFKISGINIKEAENLINNADRKEERFNIAINPIEKVVLRLQHSKSELSEYNANGIFYIFEIREKKPIPWTVIRALIVLSIVQIALGVIITGASFGVGSNFGVAFIAEGIGDLMRAATSLYCREFSWGTYLVQKSISLALSLVTAGYATYQTASVGAQLIDDVGMQAASVMRNATLERGWKTAGQQLLTTTVESSATMVATNIINSVGDYGLEKMQPTIIKQINDEVKKLIQKDIWQKTLDKLYAIDSFSCDEIELKKIVLEAECIIDKIVPDVNSDIFLEFDRKFTEALRKIDNNLPLFEDLLLKKLRKQNIPLTDDQVKSICLVLKTQKILTSSHNINLEPLCYDHRKISIYEDVERNIVSNIDWKDIDQLKVIDLNFKGDINKYKENIIKECVCFSECNNTDYSQKKKILRIKISNLFNERVQKTFDFYIDFAKKSASGLANMGINTATKNLSQIEDDIMDINAQNLRSNNSRSLSRPSNSMNDSLEDSVGTHNNSRVVAKKDLLFEYPRRVDDFERHDLSWAKIEAKQNKPKPPSLS